MYSISDVLLVQLFAVIVIYNSPELQKYFTSLKRNLPFLNMNLSKLIKELNNFYFFICKINPLILDYDIQDDMQYDLKEQNNNEEERKEEPVREVLFENKYLDKFKKFPDEYQFSELELDDEQKEYEQIKESSEQQRSEQIQEIMIQLEKITNIQNNGNINNTGEDFTKGINEYGINKILDFFDLEEEYEDDPDDIAFEELYMDLLKKKSELEKELIDIESKSMTDDDYRKLAREKIINKKLDKYIDNYVLEYTPLGNIYMRYNNDKKSFEYFSNNTIPYRYLEPVGRKYVMTYWCKPIFVDIDEELKRAEVRYDEEKKKKEEEDRKREEDKKNNPKKILAQLKNYNKDTKDQSIRPMKNRNNNVLPPQIQANLPDVNKQSEKQLLKENANRYTWEGRLTNFCPLKKIDRKILDKKLTMSYSEFKKLQQQQQNKK